MTPKQRLWLERIRSASDGGGGMYSGERVDFVPDKIVRWLDQNGFVDWVMPHNPSHKERIKITYEGRKALEG